MTLTGQIQHDPALEDNRIQHRLSNLKYLGGTWATFVGGSILYNWNRNIPTNLKIIHSRMYAQAATIAAIGMLAGLEAYQQWRHDQQMAAARAVTSSGIAPGK